MAIMIKTTINLPESLYQQAKMKAIEQKTTFTKLIYRGLVQQIHQSSVDKPEKKSIERHFNTLPDKKLVIPKGKSILDLMFESAHE